MADEVAPNLTAPAAPAAASSVATPAPVETSVQPSPAAISPPAASEGAAPVTPSVEPTPVKEESKEGFLGTDPKADKPVEASKDATKSPEAAKEAESAKDAAPATAADGEPQEESSQSADPAPLPTYEPFTLPEGFTSDTEKLGEFTKELAEFELASKADHAQTQALGQKLMDRHIAELNDALERQTKLYADFWEKKKNDWKESFIKDPELGGNRMETTINNGRDIIRNYGGTAEQQQEIRDFLMESGGNAHPAIIRMLNNISKSPMVREGTPIPAQKPAIKQSKTGKWYGGSAA